MRGYECYYYRIINSKDKKGKITSRKEENTNHACWAGIDRWLQPDDKAEYILIETFRHKETEQYIPLIIKIINKITPCEYVPDSGENPEFIKFTFVKDGTYDQNLILLNFIRYLWNCPVSVNKRTYSVAFFEHLSKRTFKDGMRSLSKAAELARLEFCAFYRYPGGHSSYTGEKVCKERTTEDLMAYKGRSVQEFFTKDEWMTHKQ